MQFLTICSPPVCNKPIARCDTEASLAAPAALCPCSLLLLPALAILISLIIPFVIGVYWSLTDYKLTSTLPKQFIGLRNYQALLQDPAFWNSVRVTLTYVVVALLDDHAGPSPPIAQYLSSTQSSTP